MSSGNKWRAYLRFITAHPRCVVALLLGLTLFFAYEASHLVLKNTLDIWLPRGNPYVETTREIQAIFDAHNIVVVAIAPQHGDIYQPAVLERIVRLHDKILAIPEAVPSSVLSVAARKAKSIRGTPEGMEVRPLLERIPTTPEEIAKLKQDIAANPFYHRALVSDDGKVAALVADFKQKPDAVNYTSLYEEIRAAVDSERDPSVALYVGGTVVNFATIEQYTTQGAFYFGVAFVIIMLVQYGSFRSLQGMFLPMLTATLSVLWALGILHLRGLDLDAVNSITTILIMAITSGHAIQLLKRYYEEYARLKAEAPAGTSDRQLSQTAVVESGAKVGSVMLIAGCVAAATFLSLELSKIDMIRHFGFLAGVGILSGLVIEMTLIPALRSLLRPPKRQESQRQAAVGVLDRLLLFISDKMVSRHAPAILAIGTLVVAAIAAGAFRLHVDNSNMRFLGADSQPRKDERVLNRALGGSNTIYFLVEGKEPDSIKDPRVLMAMERLQTFLNRQDGIGKTQSLADLVKRMNKAMHNDDPAYDVIPQDRDLVAQYLFLYSLSGDPDDFNNYVDNDYQRALVWTFVKNDSTAYAEEIFAKVQPILARDFPPSVTVRIGGSLSENSALNDTTVREKILNTIQMAAVIFVLTTLLLRSAVGGLFVVTPVLIIVCTNFGLMGWLGIPLDLGTATTASMAIGIGADYEIYLLYRFREELARGVDLKTATDRSLTTSGKAILFVAMAVAGGYAVLLTSDFAFYSRLAMAVIATMLVSALSAIVFLRAMIVVFKPRFMLGRTPAQALHSEYAPSDA